MKIPSIIIAIILLSLPSYAQVKFGPRVGVSTTDVSPEQLLIKNLTEVEQLGISVKDAKYGAHFGLFLQAKMGKFFVQPEVLFNSNTVTYDIEDFGAATNLGAIKEEKFQYLDMPLMLGFKLGPVRLQGGPVGHLFLNSKSELTDISTYEQNISKMSYGWQAGVGLDIWKFVLDFKYEGDFSKYGDHITFAGQQFNFDERAGRVVVSLGYAF